MIDEERLIPNRLWRSRDLARTVMVIGVELLENKDVNKGSQDGQLEDDIHRMVVQLLVVESLMK